MAKRRATPQSDEDDEVAISSPASKRARTEEEEEVVVATPPRRRRDKGKGKARQNDDDDEEEDANDNKKKADADNEQDDAAFEAENADAIRFLIESKSKGSGGIAQHGIIESLEMHQFMCHPYLTFNFGPQVNFIIGHNGSGKSAVLSAITVALGGKANSTGRGNGLKSFIREGQSHAEVTISLKNQGEEAYKPEIYGESVVITRKFTKEGSSSYKIQSKGGKLVSTKREELAAICDHMNIQVDNPMNVLTQDSARQFLSASHPSDKYHFFLRGTQLSQLSEEYEACLENIGKTAKVLEVKKESIPELKKAQDDAIAKFKEASKARDQAHKANELKKELAWAHVASKEEEMTTQIEEVAKLQRRIPKLEDNVRLAEAKFAEATQTVKDFEAELEELGDIDDLSKKRDEIKDQMTGNKAKLAAFRHDEHTISENLKGLDKMITNYNDQIDLETKKMQTETQTKRDETKRKLEEAKRAVVEAGDRLREVQDAQRQKIEERDTAKTGGEQERQALQVAEREVADCRHQLERCREQEDNSLAPYGRDMKAVIAKIQSMRWLGRTPIGPLGQYVKVRDGEKWANVMRVLLGNMMQAFAVTDARDSQQLKNILQESSNSHCQIVVSEYDLFDYSMGEPASGLTVLRALDISDPYVLRLLINQSQIERTFLAPTRGEAEAVITQHGHGAGVALSADGFNVRRFAEGGGSSTPLPSISRGDSRQLLFTGRDSAAQLQHCERALQVAESKCKEIQTKFNGYKRTYDECMRAIGMLKDQEKRLLDQGRRLKDTRDVLQDEANEELPAGIVGLEEAKQEAEAEKDSFKTQYEALLLRKKEVDDAQKPLLQESDRLKGLITDFEVKRGDIVSKIENAAENRLKAQSDKAHYVDKLAKEQQLIAEKDGVAKTLESEFELWTERASEYCARVPNPRKATEIQRILDSVTKALKEREKRDGASVEEMTIEVNKTKAAYDAANKDLKDMSNLNKVLKSSLAVRLAKWHEFRRHIALRCKMQFQYHLSNRGYFGRVLFDHTGQKLELKVQTDDQAGTQSKDKDPRSLSGGEKSFSTICLLLSLWEAIGCPIRCLDEFDVFMDAVNRRISMKMMIETAKSSDSKQYILITPQDMTGINIGAGVRVHRMSDPERGQGVLNF